MLHNCHMLMCMSLLLLSAAAPVFAMEKSPKEKSVPAIQKRGQAKRKKAKYKKAASNFQQAFARGFQQTLEPEVPVPMSAIPAIKKNAQEAPPSCDPITAQEQILVFPLTYVARYGLVEDLKMALELNPDAGVYDEFGFSALHTCLFNSCQECALAMIPLLASKVGVDYPTQKATATLPDGSPIKRSHNRTALFMAAKMGSKPFMQTLLALKANINHRDSQGRTPLDRLAYDMQRIARVNPDFPLTKTHYQETGQFLEQHGAQSESYRQEVLSEAIRNADVLKVLVNT